ncbi:PEP/pyruvate-binding domain-containing protein [Mycobacterium sp.]|uniref:PEP/pyruvate-binding domain-containing protein n=1 Tax=Mycobacterium sp. TaxID=1785 RepID=UPI0025DD333A|nr:PEP/pyruvate-binding domain-containing protein [Mycobacterium sp.]
MHKQAMSTVLRFDEPGADSKALVGGKGANLGRCAAAGFPVPPGFNVTTGAYSAFIHANGLDQVVTEALDGLDFADSELVEQRVAAIRGAITGAALPDQLASEITRYYTELGDEPLVAVRSSGTAEDLAEASFAGQHDTYLHIRGAAGVLDAVRQCWASLWSARATVYRHQNGLHDPAEIRMAVVVQTMIEPTASGVMFTANPSTANTDEAVINANWGLGETVVQGIVTPDEYVVRRRRTPPVGIDQRLARVDEGRLEVKACSIGTKEERIVLDPDRGRGTVTQPVPEAEQSVPTLTDEQAVHLAQLGRRVQAFYDDMPQDIEWALAQDDFWLLQSRPITGVDFDWGADLESFQWAVDDERWLWSDGFAKMLVTGSKSALYAQFVTEVDTVGYYSIGNRLGIAELMGPAYTNDGADLHRTPQLQVHKYHRGELYHNTDFEKILHERAFVPVLRSPEISPFIAPEQAQETHQTPFDYDEFSRMIGRVTRNGDTPGRIGDKIQEFIDTAAAKSYISELPARASLSDDELKRRITEQWHNVSRYTSDSFLYWLVYGPQLMALWGRVIHEWYDGDNTNAFAELLQGVTHRTKTLDENLALFELAMQIRESETLSKLFAAHPGAEFFTAIAGADDGDAFLKVYDEFVAVYPHRGQEDRDFAYPRRYEDASVDYRVFEMHLNEVDPVSPLDREDEVRARRDAVYEEVIANIMRDQHNGAMKAHIFRYLYDFAHRYMAQRDDERWAYEHFTLCIKIYGREIGRRCVERGILDHEDDFLMLCRDELFDALDGVSNPKLVRAKVAGRRRDHDRSLHEDHEFPAYLRDGREAVVGEDADVGLHGTGWTSGTVTATARVVWRLAEVGRVKRGEILVCHHTDPGWTAVFSIISGIVTETGGVLSHATCLSREYGLPSVQLTKARKLIPDGATITINGGTGEVTIVEESEHPAGAETNNVVTGSEAQLVPQG